MFALVAALAIGAAIINGAYVIRHRGRQRSWLRGLQSLVCAYVAAAMILDAAHLTDMSDVSGWLFLLGVALVLSASLAEGIVDL